MELKELHEEVFKFLLEKRKADPSLRYTLSEEYLDRGYWFTCLTNGKRGTIYFSLWNIIRQANIDSYPVIRFEMDTMGQSSLHINTNGVFDKLTLKIIAESLGCHSSKRMNEFIKIYPPKTTENQLEYLEYFVSVERPFINSFFKLRGVESDYPSVSEVEFLTKFENIQVIREKREEGKFFTFLDNRLLIETLHLENINAFKSLHVSLHKQVTCFVGGNGSGKTTILRAIALGLIGFNELKTKPNLLSILGTKEDETFYHSNGTIDVTYKLNNVPNYSGVSFSSVEKGRALFDAKNDEAATTLLTKEEAYKALIVGFAQQSYADPKLSNRRRPNISDLESLILNKPDNRFEEFVQWFRKGLNWNSTEYGTFRTNISRIINVINNCIREEEGDTTNDIDFIGITNINLKTQQNPLGIPIDKLSQGYRNLFGWVGFFAKRLYEYHLTLIEDGILPENINFLQLPAVCLIDEIDTYLHPDWQYSILKGLVDSFPNVQFIITSHSPFVLTSVPSDKITIYDLHTEGGEIVMREIEENLYGADANRASEIISSKRSAKFDNRFDKLQNDIDNNNLEAAKENLKDLIEVEKVDENLDLDIIRAKRLIRTKELLNKTKPVAV